MSLAEYDKKRDFTRTQEPKGHKGNGASHRFVIQKHAATRLHFDLRLEIDGVLKSWAVPKGVPFEKAEKRLAVQVEDHPVSYINFEGTIPKGQYGGGTVMVWDKGFFTADVADPAKELRGGKLHFTLHGKKLNGEWYLVRMHGSSQWLLIKSGESMKPVSKKLDDTSALSGKNLLQLGVNGSVWNSNQPDKPETKPKPPGRTKPPPPLKKSRVQFIEPMKARLAAAPPSEGEWQYEIKFDGYRALADKQGSNVVLLSRNEKDFAPKFPEVAEAVAKLKVQDALIDGEIVALDQKGVSSFQLLQSLETGATRPSIYFYAFDLLRLNSQDLRHEPLAERKNQLEKLLKKSKGVLRYSASLGSNAKSLLQQSKKLGLEGLIGKRADSLYEAGQRSGAWIKLKFQSEQEFVIGGYTNPEGSRPHFGALLIGYFNEKKLMFCGKVGTGFNVKLLKELHAQFETIAANKCPFINLPETKASRYSVGITAAEMKRCHWLKPALAAQVKFSEWTRDGKLRQPVFLGLREDKNAAEVVRESAR